MRTVVTGTAGFIGSTLAAALVSAGHEVRGIDAFTDYYDPGLKNENVGELLDDPRFELVKGDLVDLPLHELLEGADIVFHLAGQPGVRSSWADGFGDYVDDNVLATQRVLEAAKRNSVQRVVYASSSSVYGNAARYPCTEEDLPQPFSPYGVTKLAGEHLCCLYAKNYDLPTVALRYFTVFGPRQRPEMGMAQIFDAALNDRPFTMFAAPGAVRDFTFVDDVVRATLAAGFSPEVSPGTVLNISGGSPATMSDVLETVEDLLGRPVTIDVQPPVAGDVVRTGGSADRAREVLGWEPAVSLREGLARQLEWHRSRRWDEAVWREAQEVPSLGMALARAYR